MDRAAGHLASRWEGETAARSFRLVVPAAVAGEMPGRLADLISRRDVEDAVADLASWPGYKPTPIIALPGAAARFGVAAVACKWEGARFGVGSFKPLGPSYALIRHLRRRLAAQGVSARGAEILSGAHREKFVGLRACAATSGNHGRAVAWAARETGLACRIYVPEATSAHRREAIAAFGAEVVEAPGAYDDAARAAAQSGDIVVAGYGGTGDPSIAIDMSIGYAVLAMEAIAATAVAPTHVFVAGGSGRLAASVLAGYWHRYGAARPHVVVVEPLASACLIESAAAGESTVASGAGETMMDGLVVERPAALAWAFLASGAHAFLAIGDAVAAPEVGRAARGEHGDPPLAIGETGIAAWAGLAVACRTPELRDKLQLDRESRPLIIACEGPTDPSIHAALVAAHPEPAA